ncbi:MAG: acyl carrier protein [Sulfitobacter sp.]
MTNPNLEVVRASLAQVLETDVTVLTEDTQLDAEFDLDSVMFIQFLLCLEDSIPGLRFDPENLAEAAFNDVGKLLEFLEASSQQMEVA